MIGSIIHLRSFKSYPASKEAGFLLSFIIILKKNLAA
jgi:hypothetical protein